MIITEDFRTLSLVDWLQHDLLLNLLNLAPASSDASFRRYFRATTDQGSYIVMDAPPDKENLTAFIHIAEMLRSAGINTPQIYSQNLDDGFLLLQDFGDTNYLAHLTETNADALYNQAFDTLFKLHSDPRLANAPLPTYDQALLTRELNLFDEWFLQQKLGLTIPDALWQATKSLLIDSALAQPQVLVHRDYHSRNLMVVAEQTPGVLDFQDAVIGPITYDLVSLLKDCYIAWPVPRIHAWIQQYHQRLLHAGLIDCSAQQFQRWFDFMGLQRHLKVLGIFSRLDIRDSKPGYLKDIPLTFSYTLNTCSVYEELTDFHLFLNTQIKPVLAESL